MQQSDDLRLLREKGLRFRLTRQRMLILDVVRQHGHHLTAEDIHAQVKCKHPKIDVATVYRTLHWLHGVGLLRKIDVGKDRLEYEYASGTTHHHLICNVCGVEQEINNHVIESLQAHIMEHYGFEADPEHVALFGRCVQCRAAGDAASMAGNDSADES